LVGSPNTGKSVVFYHLTGAYATVSNYPGTTVEVSTGTGQIHDRNYEVVDTPGMYSLLPITDDERVGRTLLLNERPDIVIQLVDAKNLERMLPLTFQLLEAGLPLILDVNMVDEAEESGVTIDATQLERELNIPVILTAAVTGRGVSHLRTAIHHYVQPLHHRTVQYHPIIEYALNEITGLLHYEYHLSHRTIGLLLLQDDVEITNLVKLRDAPTFTKIQRVVEETKTQYSRPLTYTINRSRQRKATKVVQTVLTSPFPRTITLNERLSRLMTRPLTGIPILLVVLYFGLYQFVGVFGAQTLVEFLEGVVFSEYLNPVITDFVTRVVPYPLIQELIVGEFGIITLGLRYAIALILPIVGTFFIAFSIIEDTGYLPRMALLVDRLFKTIGLNGRAVIPMTLGFGCSTMATIVTKTLETTRERIIATFLLALAIPCSAQIGVLLGILAGNPLAVLIWAGLLIGVFLLVGFLTAQLMPGERPSFYMEIPPLRRPKLGNILLKTYSRIEWYLKEVFPMFILASVLIWLGQLTGIFTLLVNLLAYPVTWIGLPTETAVAFLFGFFRRDYGAAGLYDLQRTGHLTGVSLVVAAATLTLFVPCVAQFSVTAKERGIKTALAIALFIFPFAFLVGYLLNVSLLALGVII
jgi:ferrous iron transport protein B